MLSGLRLMAMCFLISGITFSAGAQNGTDVPPAATSETAEGEASGSGGGALTAAPVAEEVGAMAELIDKIHQGKKTGYVLIAMSIIGLALVLERLVGLRRGRIVPEGLAKRADEHFRKGEHDKVIALCQAQPSVLATIIEALVEHRTYDVADARTLADDVGSYDLKHQVGRNYPLLIIGTLAPLLGLLGTVFGMIRSFEDVAALGSLGDPRVLADGISQALVTTAMGLVIAVPALIAYHFFKVKLNGFSATLEKQTTELIRRWFIRTPLPAEAVPAAASPTKPTTGASHV